MEFLLKSGSCARNLGYLGTQTLQEIKSTNKNFRLEGCMEKLPEGTGKRADLERKERGTARECGTRGGKGNQRLKGWQGSEKRAGRKPC